MNVDDWGTSFEERPVWTTLKLVLAGFAIVVVLVILISLLTTGSLLFKAGTADIRGGAEAINKTRGDGDYRIAAYDHFYNLCASVQSDEASIRSLEQELAGGVSDERREQIGAFMTALRSSRAEKVNQYNADARKEGTVGQFRSSDLPYELNPNPEEDTICSAE